MLRFGRCCFKKISRKNIAISLNMCNTSLRFDERFKMRKVFVETYGWPYVPVPTDDNQDSKDAK